MERRLHPEMQRPSKSLAACSIARGRADAGAACGGNEIDLAQNDLPGASAV